MAPKFNETNDNIEWAKWTWNPVTGCKHGCPYCYARDLANRFYKEKFKPTFHPERLIAPFETKIPKKRVNEDGIKNVFVCSMADLFGDWVAVEWIEKVLSVVRETPQWTYIFLTKNPKRYLDFFFPENAWIGATADTQARADEALRIFHMLDQSIKFLSCEPLLEPISLNPIRPEEGEHYWYVPIDWIIVGAQSKTTQKPAKQPEWWWVEELLSEARKCGIKFYLKPNVTIRPKEYPVKRLGQGISCYL